jgi:hypothetical protein
MKIVLILIIILSGCNYSKKNDAVIDKDKIWINVSYISLHERCIMTNHSEISNGFIITLANNNDVPIYVPGIFDLNLQYLKIEKKYGNEFRQINQFLDLIRKVDCCSKEIKILPEYPYSEFYRDSIKIVTRFMRNYFQEKGYNNDIIEFVPLNIMYSGFVHSKEIISVFYNNRTLKPGYYRIYYDMQSNVYESKNEEKVKNLKFPDNVFGYHLMLAPIKSDTIEILIK